MNIGEWSCQRARVWPDRLFLKHGDRSCTNREFNDRVNRMAQILVARGIRKGDRVATLMVNCSAWLEIFFACAKTGAIMVPLNYHLSLPELARIIADCGSCVLIHSPRFATVVEQLRACGGPLECFLQHAGDACPAAAGFDDPADPQTVSEPTLTWTVALEDPLLIMSTSGTTGHLKGAVLSHENFLFGAVQNILSYGIDAAVTSLVVAPLFHIAALVASATSVIYGGGALVMRDFDNPSEIIRLIAAEKINYMFAVPVMYKMMSKAPAWENADFSHVRFFIAGGAPMPVSLIRQYQDEKGVPFVQGYGMTETLRISSLDLADARRKAGSIGKELFHTWVRIVDDDGRELPAEATGEILVKGPTVFTRYWNNPAATAQALRDGWFHTGDLGKRDAEGFIYIVGRKSELIICAGENIYAAEVEHAIEAIEKVAEVAVVGMPDAIRGEVAAAFVVLKEPGTLSGEELAAALKGRLAPYKIPKKVVFLENLPKTGIGKINKNELKGRNP